MRALLFALIVLGGFQASAGVNILVEGIRQDTIRFSGGKNSSLHFKASDGQDFFIRCDNYVSGQSVVVSSLKSSYAPSYNGGCNEAIRDIRSKIENGNELTRVELRINKLEGQRHPNLHMIPHFN